MKPRRTGAAVASAFAASGTGFAGVVAFHGGVRMPLVLLAAFLASLAWLGVSGWLRDQPGRAVLGAWAAVMVNTFLWTLAALPLAIAIVTTAIAVSSSVRRHRVARAR